MSHRSIRAGGSILVSSLGLLLLLLLLLEKVMLPVELLPLCIHDVEVAGSECKSGERTVRASRRWCEGENRLKILMASAQQGETGGGKTCCNQWFEKQEQVGYPW